MKERSAVDNTVSWIINSIIIFSGGIVGAYIFLNFSYFFLNDGFIQIISGAHGVTTLGARIDTLSPEELIALQTLLDNGTVVTQEGLLNIISEFYNNIINELIIVISVLGALAYFSVKSLSKSHAEDIAQESSARAVEHYLSTNDNVQKLLNKSQLIQEQSEIFHDIASRLETLEDRLLGLENEIMSTFSGNADSDIGRESDGS